MNRIYIFNTLDFSNVFKEYKTYCNFLENLYQGKFISIKKNSSNISNLFTKRYVSYRALSQQSMVKDHVEIEEIDEVTYNCVVSMVIHTQLANEIIFSCSLSISNPKVNYKLDL
jgi:hypothetical protein